MNTRSAIHQLNFLHILNDGFTASLPLLLPFISKDLSLSLTQVGLLGSILSILNIFLALPAGYIAVKYGGLRTLVTAVLLYALGFIGTSFSFSFLTLASLFLLAGIGFGVFHSVAFALIARLSESKGKGRVIGDFTAIGDVGRIGLSTGLTFLVAFIGWKITALTYGLSALAIFFYFLLIVLPKFKNTRVERKVQGKVRLKDYLHNPRFILVNCSGFLDALSNYAIFIFLPFLFLEKGIATTQLGFFTAVYFIGSFAGKTTLGRLTDKVNKVLVFVVSEIVMAVLFFSLGGSFPFFVLLVLAAILGFFTSGTVPINKILVAESVEHHNDYEQAFGINTIIQGFAITISPFMLGFVSDHYGIENAFRVSAVVALLATIPAITSRFVAAQSVQ
ncbi:MAG: MFS transporter [bacterium]